MNTRLSAQGLLTSIQTKVLRKQRKIQNIEATGYPADCVSRNLRAAS
jgi:hypothetical protein